MIVMVQASGQDSLVLANGSLLREPFDRLVEAAAGAGFDGIGLSLGRYGELQSGGWTDTAMRALLDGHGLRLVELEVLRGYFSACAAADPATVARRHAAERTLFGVAERFGVRHVQAIGSFSDPLGPDAAEAFAGLCDRAAEHGVLVALEFIPTSNIPDAGVATAIVTEAGRPNGGLCVDSWHHFRGPGDEGLLRAMPPGKVFVVQIDDGPGEPVSSDFIADTLHHRCVPGEGEFDLPRFLGLLRSIGVDAPISVEVMSDALLGLPAPDVAARLAAGTRAVLAASTDAGRVER